MTITHRIDYLPFADLSISSLLRTLPPDDQPKGFFYRGNLGLLQSNWVGFTGSETPTQGAKEAAYALASMIGAWEYTIVSGGCPGIDTAAHRGAVDNKLPTIVFLPHSLHQANYYQSRQEKRTNADLYEKVLEHNGLLITEYRDGSTWANNSTINPIYKWRTLERNRLIAASLVTFAIQWDSPKSGTMSTVRHAKRFGREVWVPAPRATDIETYMDQCAGTVQYLDEHNQHGLKSGDIPWMEQRLQDIARESKAWVIR